MRFRVFAFLGRRHLPFNVIFIIIMIAIGIAVIWALTAHGRDLAMSQGNA